MIRYGLDEIYFITTDMSVGNDRTGENAPKLIPLTRNTVESVKHSPGEGTIRLSENVLRCLAGKFTSCRCLRKIRNR